MLEERELAVKKLEEMKLNHLPTDLDELLSLDATQNDLQSAEPAGAETKNVFIEDMSAQKSSTVANEMYFYRPPVAVSMRPPSFPNTALDPGLWIPPPVFNPSVPPPMPFYYQPNRLSFPNFM